MIGLILYHLLISTPLVWDVNPWDNAASEVSGYKIYRGSQPRMYDTVIDVGMTNSYDMRKIVPTVPYYWAITAYNALGFESDFSNEVIWADPMPPLHLTMKKPGLLQADVFAGGTFMIEATEDFKVWAPFREFATNSDYFQMQFPTALHLSFFRLRFVSASPLKPAGIIRAQSISLMPPMPSATIAKPKLSLKKKLKNLLHYRPGHHPDIKKGSEAMTGRKP